MFDDLIKEPRKQQDKEDEHVTYEINRIMKENMNTWNKWVLKNKKTITPGNILPNLTHLT